MTLVSRNRLFLLLFVLAVAFIVVTTIFFIITMMRDSITIPWDSHRLFQLPKAPLLSSNFFAALSSAIVLVVFSAVILGIVLVNFEKTRSLEVILLSFFALGGLFEGIRIWLPISNLWANNSYLYILSGQLLFFGRVLAVVSLVSLALLSLKLGHKLNIEMVMIVAGTVAVLLAKTMPIDTLTIPSNCSVRFGYENMFLLVAASTLFAGFIAMMYQSHEDGSPEYTKVSLGFIILSLGYLILTETDCLLALGGGMALLATGSILLLVNLHRFHMWK